VDGVNFVLGLENYDIAAHRPHPPGYPVFIGLGKVTRTLIGPPALPGDHRLSFLALALVATVFGALAVIPLVRLFRSLEHANRRAAAAAILTMSCPLFWLTAVRPLSDVPGLAAALAVQAFLAAKLMAPRAEAARHDRVLWVIAFVAGVTIGIRSQTFVLTLPLLSWACVQRWRVPGATRALAGTALALTGGVMLWAVPMLVETGGLGAYLAATRQVAIQDFVGTPMLATDLTLSRLGRSLLDTFVSPWASPALAAVVLAAATVGSVVMIHAGRRGAIILATCAVPYVIFHLAFQETLTTRYALPIVPAVAYLAVRGLDHLIGRAVWPAVAGLALSGVLLAAPVQSTFRSQPSPFSTAMRDVTRAWQSSSDPVLAMHDSIGLAVRGEALAGPHLASPPGTEWLEMLQYWRQGRDAPVWFLANPRRTDLALVDPGSRSLVASYRWPFDATRFLGGARPTDVDWYEFQPPAWALGPGWALTPEVAGRSTAYRRGRRMNSVGGLVRRELASEDRILMLGGRNLELGDEDEIEVSLDGELIDRFRPRYGFFLRMQPLAASETQGPGPYSELRVGVTPRRDRTRDPDVRFEQFDLQPATSVVFGYDTGWHEPEYDPRTGQSWRWTSAAATIRLHAPGRGVLLRVQGESPRTYFDEPPVVEVLAGGRLLTRFQPAADFDWTIPIPFPALRRAAGAITIRTNRTFVPADTFGSADRRTLGLRIYDVSVTPRRRGVAGGRGNRHWAGRPRRGRARDAIPRLD
jgi:hypothetical protein